MKNSKEIRFESETFLQYYKLVTMYSKVSMNETYYHVRKGKALISINLLIS